MTDHKELIARLRNIEICAIRGRYDVLGPLPIQTAHKAIAEAADALEAQAEQVAVARAEGYAAGIEAAKKCFEGGVGVPIQRTYNEVREEIHTLHTADSKAALERVRQEERERCAKVAATFVHSRLYEPNHPACSYHSKDIAAAILGGEDE